jgi:hypothetical protein
MTPIDADMPLPDDLESAHRLIRELLATLLQKTYLTEKLRHFSLIPTWFHATRRDRCAA